MTGCLLHKHIPQSDSEWKHYRLCLSLKCMGKHFRHKSNRNSLIASSLLQANDFPEKALKAAYAIWIMTVGNSTPATGDAALNYVEHGFRAENLHTQTHSLVCLPNRIPHTRSFIKIPMKRVEAREKSHNEKCLSKVMVIIIIPPSFHMSPPARAVMKVSLRELPFRVRVSSSLGETS